MSIRVTAVLANLLILTSSITAQQSCLSIVDLASLPEANGLRGKDGYIHVTIGFADASGTTTTPDSVTSTAITSALSEWNAFKATTNVQFDFAPPGVSPDIQLLPSSDATKTGGCAAFQPSTSRLYYAPQFLASATSNPDNGRLIFSHELGHSLGLADAGTSPTKPTIMNNPVPGPDACTNPIITTRSVQTTDASFSPTCQQQGKNQYYKLRQLNHTTIQTEPGAKTFIGRLQPQSIISCTYTYNQLDFYVTSGGETDYAGSSLNLVSVDCN